MSEKKQFVVSISWQGYVSGGYPHETLEGAREEAAKDSARADTPDVVIKEETLDDDGKVVNEMIVELVKGSGGPFAWGILVRNARAKGIELVK